MKKMMLSFALTSAMLFAQTATTTTPSGSDNKTSTEKQTQSASDDTKDAGSDLKDAGKDIGKAGKATGRATKKGAKKAWHGTKKAVHKGAEKTSDATDTDKRSEAAPPPADATRPK